MHELIKNMNLSTEERTNLLLDLMSENSQIKLIEIIKNKFELLNDNLVVLDFLKMNDVEFLDLYQRNSIVESLKKLPFYSLKPCNLTQYIRKKFPENFFEFSMNILTQLNIPASFLIESTKYAKDDYKNNCFEKILQSNCSFIEKYYCIKELDRNLPFNIKSTPFFEYLDRKTGEKWYCSIFNSKRYYILQKEPNDDKNLQDEDFIALIYKITNDSNLMSLFSIDDLDENVQILFENTKNKRYY